MRVLDAYEVLEAVAAAQRNEGVTLRATRLGWQVIAELERLHACAVSPAERLELAGWIKELRVCPQRGWQYVARAQEKGAVLVGTP